MKITSKKNEKKWRQPQQKIKNEDDLKKNEKNEDDLNKKRKKQLDWLWHNSKLT